jgi:hypothetical protein
LLAHVDTSKRKWIYLIASIVVALLAVAICFIKESRPSRVLKAYLDRHHANHGFTPKDCDVMPSFKVFVTDRLKKPLILLCTEPILLVVTMMSASVYGFAYLLTEALPRIYSGFGYTAIESASVYLFLCIGPVLALSMRLLDIHLADRRERRGQSLVRSKLSC